MTENKRYIVKGTDDFFQHIEDTTLTEDKHEGAIYNIYQVVDLLNKQDNKIQRCKLAYNQLASHVDANFDEYMTQKKLNERIQELETVIQDIVYETRYTVGKDYGEVCVFVSPQTYKRLNELLKEKTKW